MEQLSDYMRKLVETLRNGPFMMRHDNLYLHKDLTENTHIYRYTKMPYAIELLESKKLYVANRSFMSDLREQGKKKDLHNIFDDFMIVGTNRAQEKRVLGNMRKLKAECYQACISCWTKRDDDNILLWRSFGENTCRISTTIGDLINSIKPIDHPIFIAPITYGDERTYDSYDKIFKKHIGYKDENEIRLCIINNCHHILLDIDPEILVNEIMLNPFENKKYLRFLETSISNRYSFLKDKIVQSDLIEG